MQHLLFEWGWVKYTAYSFVNLRLLASYLIMITVLMIINIFKVTMTESPIHPSTFLDVVQVALEGLRGAMQQRSDLDGVLIRLEALLQSLVWVEPVFSPSLNFSKLLAAVSDMISCVNAEMMEQSGLRPRGRPRLNISESALRDLLEQEFTQVEIAQILGCCTKTVHRRIA